MKKIFLVFSLVLLLVVNSTGIVFAAEADKDTSFDVGHGFTYESGGYVISRVQSDGKIIIGGEFTKYGGVLTGNIARLNTDGTLDNTFVTGEGFTGGFVSDLLIQSDGKIIVVGDFPVYNNVEIGASIVRLNPNGSLDESFNAGETGVDGYIQTVVKHSDGRLLIGGNFDEYDGVPAGSIARLNADGTLDNTFVTGEGFTAGTEVATIAIQADNSIVVGGFFDTYNTVAVGKIARLNENGVLDVAFNTAIGGGFDGNVLTLEIQSTGEILVGGVFENFKGAPASRIIRLNADGTRDNTFFIGNGFTGPFFVGVSDFLLTTGGKIIVTGSFGLYNVTTANNIISLNLNGSIDSTFGAGAENHVYTISEYGGKFIASGYVAEFDGNDARSVFRINADYSHDGTFSTGTGFILASPSGVVVTALQSDDKILVVGEEFTHYNNVSAYQLIRLNADGTRDNTFVIQGNGFNDTIYDIKTQSDGKIIIGGRFTDYGGNSVTGIVRLNNSGTLDNTFNLTGSGLNGRVESLEILSDGKIIIGGNFTDYNGTSVGRIARLNSDGSLDTAFNNGNAGLNGLVRDIGIQSDGKIVVVGLFRTYNGFTANNIVRMLPDGTHDSAFAANGGFTSNFSQTFSLAIQSGDKIVVGGDFTEYNGTPVGSIIRFSTVDGTVDTTFNAVGDGFAEDVFLIRKDQNDKIIAVGPFTEYNGEVRKGLVRLNSDGSLDNTFVTGEIIPVDAAVEDFAIQSTGKIIIGGQFRSYGGSTSYGILRLIGTPVVEPEPEPEAPRNRVIGGGGGSSSPVVIIPTTPIISTDTKDCKDGDKFSSTTGANCAGITTPTGPTNPSTDSTSSSQVPTKVLRQGITDPQVKLLQIYLNAHGVLLATLGAGSPGKETSFFGPATKAALIKFQELNAKDILTPLGLTKGTGVLAAKTIGFINTH